MTVETLKSESLKLGRAERKELAYFLLDSIINTDKNANSDFSIEQQTEIEKRLEAFEKGEMVSAPSKEVLNRIRRKHGLQH